MLFAHGIFLWRGIIFSVTLTSCSTLTLTVLSDEEAHQAEEVEENLQDIPNFYDESEENIQEMREYLNFCRFDRMTYQSIADRCFDLLMRAICFARSAKALEIKVLL